MERAMLTKNYLIFKKQKKQSYYFDIYPANDSRSEIIREQTRNDWKCWGCANVCVCLWRHSLRVLLISQDFCISADILLKKDPEIFLFEFCNSACVFANKNRSGCILQWHLKRISDHSLTDTTPVNHIIPYTYKTIMSHFFPSGAV